MLPRKIVRTATPSPDCIGAMAEASTAIPNGSDGDMAGKRKVGRVKDLLDMPVDIITEVSCRFVTWSSRVSNTSSKITRHMHPQDLLNLSWSSKSLHKFFMKRGSNFVWKESFRNLRYQLPLPDGIVEPVLAILLFTKFCTVRDHCSRAPQTMSHIRLCRDAAPVRRRIRPCGSGMHGFALPVPSQSK